MCRSLLARACALSALLFAPVSAHAHGVAGARIFVSTLQLDDPAVADEAAVPTASWAPQSGAVQYNVAISFAKRITEDFGLSIGTGYSWLANRDKTRSGWQNINLGAKYLVYVNPEHEFMASVGVSREFARTGAVAIGADTFSTTTPSVTWGKGLGDLPIGVFRPFAITGELGYAISEHALKIAPDGSNNGGHENRFTGGLSLQYSVGYLQSQVRDSGLPGWLRNLTPLVEVAWSTPANGPSATPMQWLIAPGVAYSGDWYQLTLEMTIPGNRNTGRNLGAVAEFHIYLDDLLPRSLGAPVTHWFH